MKIDAEKLKMLALAVIDTELEAVTLLRDRIDDDLPMPITTISP